MSAAALGGGADVRLSGAAGRVDRAGLSLPGERTLRGGGIAVTADAGGEA